VLKKTNAVVVYPVNPALIASSVNNIIAANIPVVTIGRKVEGISVDTYVGFDYLSAGRSAASFIARSINGQGTVVMLRDPKASSEVVDLSKGFTMAMDAYPKIELVVRDVETLDRSKSFALVADIVEKGKIDAIFAQDDEVALGAAQAVQAAAKGWRIHVVGVGGTNEVIKAVQIGKMTGAFLYQPALIGQLAVRAAVMKSRGENVKSLSLVQFQLVGK
jgi:ribose transport system substrate-binding protein